MSAAMFAISMGPHASGQWLMPNYSDGLKRAADGLCDTTASFSVLTQGLYIFYASKYLHDNESETNGSKLSATFHMFEI